MQIEIEGSVGTIFFFFFCEGKDINLNEFPEVI